MITKLPRWVWSGAWALAFIAGMINVIGLIGYHRQTLTHLSGTTTALAAALQAWEPTAILHLFLILLSFLGGTVCSGLIIQDTQLQIGRRYSIDLLLGSVLLGVAAYLLDHGHRSGLYFACAASGLQNAMITTYSGAVIRTTHVSGMYTDLGLALGHFLRRKPVDGLRLRLSLIIISAFFCGGVAGSWSFRRIDYAAMWIPAALTAAAAVSYAAFRWRSQAHATAL